MTFNTRKSFDDKWKYNGKLVFKETLSPDSNIHQWILKRNGWKNLQVLKEYLHDKKSVLDAGCGNGRVTALLRIASDQDLTQIVGIDLVSDKVAKNNLKDYKNVSVYRKDLLSNLDSLGKFDFIYCQEVLHHTDNPEKAFHNLVQLLNKNGEIAIYVYKKKAPVREYVDDFIRDKISELDYRDAIKICRQITNLGKTLAKIDKSIDIPDVKILDIPKGAYSIQRFFYHFFMKCYWNPDISYKENVAINYDWYHPQNCSRHTLDEIRGWFINAKLKIVHEYVDFYGITMRGLKNNKSYL